MNTQLKVFSFWSLGFNVSSSSNRKNWLRTKKTLTIWMIPRNAHEKKKKVYYAIKGSNMFYQ